MTGAAVGGTLDEIDAKNQAQIAAQMGAAAPSGSVTIADAVAMTRAGVSEPLIVTHIQNHGVAQPLGANEIIYLRNQGVSDGVIAAMQAPPPRPVPMPAPVIAAGPPVIVDEVYGPPVFSGPPRHYWRHHHHYHGPRTSFGFSVSR
jgi:hypothetical protein